MHVHHIEEDSKYERNDVLIMAHTDPKIREGLKIAVRHINPLLSDDDLENIVGVLISAIGFIVTDELIKALEPYADQKGGEE